MELETLKSIWQQQTIGQPAISRQDILRIAATGSKSPAASMKRNLSMEMFTVVTLYSITILYFLLATPYTWIAVALAVLVVLYFIYFSRKKRILDNMTGYNNTIRSSLEIQIKLLTSYMKWYGGVAAVLTPLIFILVLIAYYSQNPLSWYMPGNRRFYLLFACMAIAFSVLSFLVNKWYVYQLYGKHMEALKKILGELKEEM